MLDSQRPIDAAVPTGTVVDRATLYAVLAGPGSVLGDVGVVHLDLDRFHRVNTQFGQAFGDQVLHSLGPWMARALPTGSWLASVDGDAFVAVVPHVAADDVRRLADDLLAAVQRFGQLGPIAVSLRASAGVAWRSAGEQSIDLIEEAFLACRRAKTSAAGSVVGFDRELRAEADRLQRVDEELRRAIADDQLVLHVQPEVDLRSGAVTGVEALVRWEHPVEGLLGPGRFLADAEAAGLMSAVGDWVLDHAIDLAAGLRADGRPDALRVWVNLAASQIADGERLLERVREALGSGRITPEWIGFEVTESSLLEDLPGAVGLLRRLRELGIELALDDFGTGYSSLSYLRQLPVTVVKIDQRFVGGIGDSLADEAIVEAVVDLAHALGLRVIAEGIEHPAQADALIRMGADQAQGYHFGRPAPIAEWAPRLAIPWLGAEAPSELAADADPRVEQLAVFGSARARLLLTALDTAHDSVVVTGAGGDGILSRPIVYVNAAFEAETGFSEDEVLGRSIQMLLPDDVDPDVLEWFADVHRTGTAATIELPNRRADGSLFLCELTINPVFDDRGIHTHWLQVRRDLTQRRAAEGDRARFEVLIEQTPSLVFLAETGGQWLYANAAMRRAVGIPDNAPLDGVNLTTVFAPRQLAAVEAIVLPALRTHGYFEGEGAFINRVTGVETEVVTEIQRVGDPSRPGVDVFAVVSRDVTEANRLARVEAQRARLSGFAAELAQMSLELGASAVLEGVDSIVERFGRLLDADLCFFDDIDIGAQQMRPVAVWRRDAGATTAGEPHVVPLPSVSSWLRELATHQVFTLDDISDPDATAEHPEPWRVELNAWFRVDDHATGLYAPLRVDGELVGVLGLADGRADREWTTDERVTLRAVVDSLASLVARRRVTQALRDGERKLAAMLTAISDVLVVLDGDGLIRFANPAITKRLGRPVDSVIGQHFLALVHPEDQGRAVDTFVAALRGDELPVTELRVMHQSGEAIWHDLDSTGVFDEIVGGYMISLRDVSVQRATLSDTQRRVEVEQVVLELSLWALEAHTSDALEGIVPHLERLGRLLGVDGTFVEVVEGGILRPLVGWRHEDAPLDELAVASDQAQMAALVERYRVAEPIVVDDIRLVDEPWADAWCAFPVPDRSGVIAPMVTGGQAIGAVGVVMVDRVRHWSDEEITLVRRVAATVAALLARTNDAASLRTSEARLAALLDGSNDMVVVVSSDGIIRYANTAVVRALGYPLDEVIGHPFHRVVHPDDATDALARFDELVTDAPTSRITVRLVGASGEVRWWEITAGFTPDPVTGGRVLTLRDVTSRVAAERVAAAWVELLGAAFDLAQRALDLDAVDFLAELQDVCVELSRLLQVDHVYVDRFDDAHGALVNVAGHGLGGHDRRVQPGVTVDVTAIGPWLDRLRSAEPVVLADGSTGDEPWLVAKRRAFGTEGGLLAVPMTGAGRLLGVVGVSMATARRTWTEDEVTFLRIVAETIAHVIERSDVDTDRRRLESELEWQALHDPLTGLGNRILLGTELGTAIARRGRPNHVSVLLIDLDGFKEVIDTHGHSLGDQVLRVIARRLEAITRPTDTLARTGGDEFVLLCPETDADGGASIAHRVTTVVAEPIVIGDVVVEVGASVGVAHREGDRAIADQLLIEADDAMYRAKRAGRGLVRLAGEV